MIHISGLRLITLIATLAEAWANLPPLFRTDMNNIAISEKTAVGTVIYTLSGADPEGSKIHFDLQGSDALKVNRNTGDVTVVKPLDHEKNDTLNLVVSIEDEVEGGLNNIVQLPITVIVLDENDNAPMFIDIPYETIVSEDSVIGSTVFQGISVLDKDATGDSLEIECINLPQHQDACEFFHVETVESSHNLFRGSITLRRALNFTLQRQFEFLLKASDGELSNTTSVLINVTDVQDTPPKFQGPLKAEIYENASIGSLVITVKAIDGDKGYPRPVTFELLDNPFNYFQMDQTSGEIRVASPLDREALNDTNGVVTLRVKAYEMHAGHALKDDPLAVSEAVIFILINDINDEPPAFNRRDYFVELPENIPQGSILPNLDMTVFDPDEGNGSVFSLELNDISEVFSIAPAVVHGFAKVNISILNNTLDYENFNQRKFIILCIARETNAENKLSATATVTITVTDVNDNAPTFEQAAYSASISEISTAGTSVISISAKDRDSAQFGDNGIVYHLAGSGNELFDVQNRTGVVTVAECDHPGLKPCLDSEDRTDYHLQFIATDDDGKGQTSIAPLHITLADFNDNTPIFSQSIYRVNINEGALKFDPELYVTATDADATSKVTYSIVAGDNDNIFGIDTDTGKIRIAGNQGLEISQYFNRHIILTVMATDGTFTSSTIVNVTVKDINNHVPTFSQNSYVISVEENISLGSLVANLEATDMDVGDNAAIEYQILRGSYDDFKIDTQTGAVTVSSKLDYDRRNTYIIEVIARDHGDVSLTGTTTLTINTINVNDKLPYFVPVTQKVEVMENVPVGTVIHSLIALDPDVNASEALNFAAAEPITALDKYGNEVTNDQFKHFFSVDKSTGQVRVLNELQTDIASVVRITVLVTDIMAPTVQQGRGLLIISITEINDSPPKFLLPWTWQTPIYSLELKEEMPVGTIVATYQAVDEDSDIAGYAILPENEYFEINNGTGIVQIRRTIDFELIKALNFTIYAFDSGVPQLNATANVFVKIINLNDNSPIFSNNNYTAILAENSLNGTVVLQVKAIDKDSGDFGVVAYSLTGEHSKNFHINTETGIITVLNSSFIDYELVQSVVIEVVASDGGSGNMKRSATAPVYIDLLDINDNSPKFNQSEYNISVIETIRLNPPVPLIQVYATDRDSDTHGDVRYQIIGGNIDDIFLLGMDTGVLYAHKSLLNRPREFHLKVEARDEAGNGPHADIATVHIHVQNVNEHTPHFLVPAKFNSTVEINEETATENHLVVTVQATDEDEGDNGNVTYHFNVNGQLTQETDQFIIDAITGQLRTKVLLDKKRQPKYHLILVARDHGSPKWLETNNFLTILLVDSNDNQPEFGTNYTFFVMENNDRHAVIGQIQAMDHDEATSTKVYYYILEGNTENTFYLDKSDGTLYANKTIDREHIAKYELLVAANNDPNFYYQPNSMINSSTFTHSNNSYQNITNVTIIIGDENDNEPIFDESVYHAAVNRLAKLNQTVVTVLAYDQDLGINGSLSYYIKTSHLYKYGSDKSSGAIIPSPFNITNNGTICIANSLIENNQHRFIVDARAVEIALPQRESSAKVLVWIFESEQLIRVILSRPKEEVIREQKAIIRELSNATQTIVIVDDIKHHRTDSQIINTEWTDMYIIVIDKSSQIIIPVHDVLKMIDSKYDFLKDYYAGFAIENVLPALLIDNEESIDMALVALVALLVVLFVGAITFFIICCCLRHWVLSPNDLKKKDALIKKTFIDDLNTTENPLWIEQKLKIYEEQELTMQVFSDNENCIDRRSVDMLPDDNTYATIQHPNRRGSSHIASICLDDLSDYATLSGAAQLHANDQGQDSLRGVPNYYEAALGFQGSTFQVPNRPNSSFNNYDSYKTKFRDSESPLNRNTQPEYVAELI